MDCLSYDSPFAKEETKAEVVCTVTQLPCDILSHTSLWWQLQLGLLHCPFRRFREQHV